VRISLTTTGPQSGRRRTVTLYAWEDGADLVVGSRGDAAADPAWAHNLRAEPRAIVGRGKSEDPVRAREADGDEHERLWRMVVE
jgi:deazaflavin-dependent oxidoreductase (nitroreductase family)